MQSIKLMLALGLLFEAMVNLVEADRLPLEKLFRYSVAPNDPGSYSEYGEDVLNAIADDAYALATQGSQAMIDYQNTNANTHNEAKRLVDVTFFKPSTNAFEIVKTRIDGVKNWMESRGNLNNSQNKKKPWLFCGDSWAIRQDIGSQMKDKDGNDMVHKSDSKAIRIKDSGVMKTARENAVQTLGIKAKYLYPYWLEGIGAYVFMNKWSEDITKNVCDGEPNARGFTLNQGYISLIVLCPKSFTGVRLHEKDVDAFQSNLFHDNEDNPPQNVDTTRVKDVVPAGSTLYHELFHLYWGVDLYPSGGEEYKFRRMTGMAERTKGRPKYVQSQAMSNPENYALQAVAYDYTLSKTAGSNHSPVEFYTGFATYTE